MAAQLFRPWRVYQSAQYEIEHAQHLGQNGILDPLAATFVPGPPENKQVSDDDDATYVLTRGHAAQGGSIIVTDFDPIPLPDGPPDDVVGFGVMFRVQCMLTPQDFDNFVLTNSAWIVTRPEDPGPKAYGLLGDCVPIAPVPEPTTYSTGYDWYYLPRTVAQAGFSFAYSPSVTNLDDGVIVDVYRIFEIGLWFDIPGGLPPCRQFPRTDGLGASSGRRHFPLSRSQQGSARRFGGYY